MCGIFSFFGTQYNEKELLGYFNKIQHRGPDNSQFLKINESIYFGFHRLRINGLDESSNQPFTINNKILICNGEIFNFEDLKKKYNLEEKYKSNSDCEVIIHLYEEFGIEKTCELLDGEFSFILFDKNVNKVFIGRDQLGIRPLFIGKHEKEFILCSEMKGIPDIFETNQFKPGHYAILDLENGNFHEGEYFNLEGKKIEFEDEEDHIENIRVFLRDAVQKRLMSDRNIGCLLSGGLDSTIITGLVASNFEPYSINTYSIGMKGSVDLKYSKMAAKYFKTNHTIVEFSNEDFIHAIEKTIIQIESYDVTTVRASIGNYLIACYIRDNSEDRVIFCGDVSDEIFGSYRGFYYSPSDEEFEKENIHMLKNIQYFDVLRSDRSISGAGLEARVPFGDKDLIQYVMSIQPRFKRFDDKKMEKYLLRKAFEDLMPQELTWRVKTAFSDGIGSEENPWHIVLKKYIEDKYTDDEFLEKTKKYLINPPYDRESLYYREIFENYYPNKDNVIPYFWKQPFMDCEDPSAWCAESNKKDYQQIIEEINQN